MVTGEQCNDDIHVSSRVVLDVFVVLDALEVLDVVSGC